MLDSGFESGTKLGFKDVTNGGTFSIANSPVASGKYSAKFDLIYNGSNYRAEAQPLNLDQTGKFQFDQEYWIKLKYYHQNWAYDTSGEIGPFQIHNAYQNWDAACTLNNGWSKGPLLMASIKDTLSLRAYNNNVIFSEPIKSNKWHTIVVHFKISYTNNGLVEVWLNGVKRGKYVGVTSAKYDNCNNILDPPYFKMGIYKWGWKTQASLTNRRTLFIDDLQIMSGAGTNLVSNIIPSDSESLSGVTSDSFDGSTLNPVWQFIDPVGQSKMSMTGNQVALTVNGADTSTNLNRAKVLQSANNTDFLIEAKFDSEVFNKGEMQGLTVEQDISNYLRYHIVSDGSSVSLRSTVAADGNLTTKLQLIVANGKPIYLRLLRKGNQFTLSYSYTGEGYYLATQYDHTLSVTKLGLFAGTKQNLAQAFNALIDYFKVSDPN
jgi:hypothetical protein